MDKNHPFFKIHHVNQAFNKFFEWPLVTVGFFISVINLCSPYYVRVALAFLINIFFNRPLIYLNYIGEFVSKRLSWIFITLFYVTIFGFYALIYKIIFKNKTLSTWEKVPAEKDSDNYYYQS